MFTVAKQLDGSRWHSARRQASAQATLCEMGTQPPYQKGGRAPSPIFDPHGWMHQGATWYGGRPQSRGLCVRWGPSHPPKRGAELPPPIFGPCLLWPNGWVDQSGTWHGGRPWPRPHGARWGLSSPLQKGGRAPPKFAAHLYCDQTAECIKLTLGMEVGLSPGDFVLHGDPAPAPKVAERPIFGPRLLWPNSCMDQDGTWYGGRPRPTRHCVRWGPSPLSPKGAQPPSIFGQCQLWPNGLMDYDATWYRGRPRPRRLCVRCGPGYPQKKANPLVRRGGEGHSSLLPPRPGGVAGRSCGGWQKAAAEGCAGRCGLWRILLESRLSQSVSCWQKSGRFG